MMRIMRTRLGKGLHLGVGMVMLFVQMAFLGQTGLAAAVYVGPPATIGVTASPSTVSADGLSTATITATVYDVYGNPVPYTTLEFSTDLGTLGQPQMFGASVHRGTRLPAIPVTAGRSTAPVDLRSVALTPPVPSLAASSSGSTAGPFWTDQNGQAQDTISSTQTGTATITVTADNGVVGTVQVNFASPTGGKVELVASPTSIPPNGTTTSTLTATVYGPNGQPAPGTQVTFQTTLGQLNCYSCVRTTDPAGQTSVQFTSGQSGQAVITALATNFSPGVAQVVVTSVQLHLYATTYSIPADGVTSSTVSAVVYDSSGQPMSGVEVNFSVTNSPDIRAFFDSCLSCINEGVSTSNQGMASVTVSSIPISLQDAGTATISADAVGVQGALPLTFTKPSGGHVDVSVSPQNIVPVASGTVSVVARVYDAQNQAMSGVRLDFTAASGWLASNSGTTNAQGQAQENLAVWNSWYGPAPAGPDTVTVMAANLLPGNATVNIDYSALSVVAPPVTAGMTTSISVYASNYVDQWGTPTNQPLSGVSIELSASGGSVTPAVGSTNSQGVLTAQLAAKSPGPVTLTAVATGNFAGSVAPAQATVSFDATAASVGVSVAPSEVPADGHSAAVVTATVEDTAGSPVAGAPVRFTSNLGVLGQQGVLSTNVDGQVTDTVYSLTAGTAQVTATSGGVSKAAQVVFYPPTPSRVQVWASREDVPADGKITSTVTARVTDSVGYMLAGVPVSFSTNLGSLGKPLTVLTDYLGEASDTITSATAGTAMVTAVVAGVSGTTTVAFSSAVPYRVQVSASPWNVPADGKTTTTVTATVLDVGGQPVVGVPVSFSTSLGTLLPLISGVTNAQGEITAAVYSATAGTAVVTATSGGVSNGAQVVFYSTTPSQVQVWASPGAVPADGRSASIVTARVLDSIGQPVVGVPVSFSTSLGTLLPPISGVTNAQGEVTQAVYSVQVGTAVVTATTEGIYGTATVDFLPGTLLFTSVQGQAAASAWGKQLPADNCSGAGCGSTAGQALPWTFAGISFAVGEPTVTGDVYITGDAAAGYVLSITPAGQGAGTISTSGSFSPETNKVIDLNSLIPAGDAIPGYSVTIALVASGSTYGVGNIYVRSVGDAQISGLVPVGSTMVQLGNVTGTVGNTVNIPLALTAAPEPVVSWTMGAGGTMSYNSAILQFEHVVGGTGISVESSGTATSPTFSLDDPNGATVGTHLGTIQFTCLAPGQSQVSMSGAQYTTTAGWTSSGTAPTTVGQVSCVVPTTPLGISGFTPNAVPEVTPGAHASFDMTITGWGLNSAQAVNLMSQTGSSNVTGLVYSKAVGGGELGIAFWGVPLGAYTVQVVGADGNAVSGATYFVVAPGIPLFTVTEHSPWYTTPGEASTYEWTVTNQGLVPGVDLVLIHFPVGISAMPTPGLKVSDLGNGLDLVAVPVQPGATATFGFQELLPSSQVQYPGQYSNLGSANIQMGSLLYTAFVQVGSLTDAQWDGMNGLTGWPEAQSAMAATVNLDQEFASEVQSTSNYPNYVQILSKVLPADAQPTGAVLPEGAYLAGMPMTDALPLLFNITARYSNALWMGILTGNAAVLEGYINGLYGTMDRKQWLPFSGPTWNPLFEAGMKVGQVDAQALAQPSGDPTFEDIIAAVGEKLAPVIETIVGRDLTNVFNSAVRNAYSSLTVPQEETTMTNSFVGNAAYQLRCDTIKEGACSWWWPYQSTQALSTSEIQAIEGTIMGVQSAAAQSNQSATDEENSLKEEIAFLSNEHQNVNGLEQQLANSPGMAPTYAREKEDIAALAAKDSINCQFEFDYYCVPPLSITGSNDPAVLVSDAVSANKALSSSQFDPIITDGLAYANSLAPKAEQQLQVAMGAAEAIQGQQNALSAQLNGTTLFGVNRLEEQLGLRLTPLISEEDAMTNAIANAWTISPNTNMAMIYNNVPRPNIWWEKYLQQLENHASGLAATYLVRLALDPAEVTNAVAPNFIAVSPLGVESENYVSVNQNLYVQVHFENSPKANAPAQNVRVDVQLGRNFDPNSVKLIPNGPGVTPLMSVTSSGLVRFYFNNINLPLDTNPPNGEGMVEFQVLPNGNLPDNAPLTVSGNVYFDSNPPVATQTLTYHIDATTPTATVAPLPTQSPTSFPVSWSGSDAGGPGIADYTVLASVNGGPYSDWMQGTTVTSAVYDGQPGDRYSFIVQAQDLLGQTQPMPSQAQASTTVVSAGGGGGGDVPVATATAGTGVGPNGGTVTAGNGALTLDVPPGAFANQTGIAAQPLGTAQAYAPPGRAFAGASLQWSISAGGMQPTKPVLATFRYDPSALNGLNPLRLGIYGYDPNTAAWQWVGGRVYGSQGTVSAELNRFGTYAVFADTNSFSDLSQAPWARNAVDTLLGADLVAGVGPGVFDPNADLTRAQFTTLLVKADGLAPVASGATPFTDVVATAWYAPYVAAAYHAGLVAGVSPTSFDPNGDLTREQLAVMLAKLLGSGVPSGSLSRFTDAASIGSWARSGVAVAVGAGLMSGYPGGAFRPTGISSRAQAAAVLAQYLAYVGKV